MRLEKRLLNVNQGSTKTLGELHQAIFHGKNGEVTAEPHVFSDAVLGAFLANNDLTR